MITNANEMLKALKRGTYCGVILYQGPSMIDGAPIAVHVVARQLKRVRLSRSLRMARRPGGLWRRLDIAQLDVLRL